MFVALSCNTGLEVNAAEAVTFKDGTFGLGYACPKCLKPVTLRTSKTKAFRDHFAHINLEETTCYDDLWTPWHVSAAARLLEVYPAAKLVTSASPCGKSLAAPDTRFEFLGLATGRFRFRQYDNIAHSWVIQVDALPDPDAPPTLIEVPAGCAARLDNRTVWLSDGADLLQGQALVPLDFKPGTMVPQLPLHPLLGQAFTDAVGFSQCLIEFYPAKPEISDVDYAFS